ncbi:MAG: hypothetical protein RL885_04840 [Planctomycetota bacterium]
MSWFKKPVAYRSYSDGTYEIIERRSFLRISTAALAVVGIGGGLAAGLVHQGILGSGSAKPTTGSLNRPPAITHEAAMQIIQSQDRAAVYQILGRYHSLDVVERRFFWLAVASLGMADLKPFAKNVVDTESDRQVVDTLRAFLEHG